MFGRGLVRTVDDFVHAGETPSHPELLDYLAKRLIEVKWSIKALIREIGQPSNYGSPWLASPWKFNQHVDTGMWVSELFPNLARHADDLCLLNGMHCDQPADQSPLMGHDGSLFPLDRITELPVWPRSPYP
jgi:hypothetical protein